MILYVCKSVWGAGIRKEGSKQAAKEEGRKLEIRKEKRRRGEDRIGEEEGKGKKGWRGKKGNNTAVTLHKDALWGNLFSSTCFAQKTTFCKHKQRLVISCLDILYDTVSP